MRLLQELAHIHIRIDRSLTIHFYHRNASSYGHTCVVATSMEAAGNLGKDQAAREVQLHREVVLLSAVGRSS